MLKGTASAVPKCNFPSAALAAEVTSFVSVATISKITLKNLQKTARPKTRSSISTFTSHPTTSYPQKHHIYEPFFAKTPAKTKNHSQKFFPSYCP
jgi:hypothetical protein